MPAKIAVLTHFYPPEPCAAANRVASLVAALARDGHDVTVVTNFPSFPAGRVRRPDRMRVRRRGSRDGARVLRLFTLVLGRWPGARLLHWIASAISSTLYLLFCRERFDMIVVSVPPITLALPALAGSWRHHAKLIVDVRDVYPDVAIAMGKWQADGLTARLACALLAKLYHRAQLIASVTPTCLRQIAARGVASDKLMLVPNGCEETFHIERAAAPESDRFVAIYAGNIGLTTDVDVLLDAAARLMPQERVTISIVGDGAQGGRLRRRVTEEGLRNVQLVGVVDKAQAMRLLAEADVAIVPLRSGISDSLPTKIFDALSVGCPVIVAAAGEAQTVTLESEGGISVPPGDAQALAEAIRSFADLDKSRLRAMGAKGRTYVQKSYRREEIMSGFARRIYAQLAPQ